MTRWKAAATHLAISLVLALLVGGLLYLLWFPPPYFVAAGASTLIMLLMGVDVGIGPLLTLLVFNPAKPRHLLRLDLLVIGVLQLAAFCYGAYVICQARPVFIVGAVDRLVVVAADQLTDTDLAKGSLPEFRRRSWSGPQLVGALPPQGGIASDMAMQAFTGGKDIDQLPAFYVPYGQVADQLMKRAKPLSQLRTTKQQREQLDELQARTPAKDRPLSYLPIERGDNDYTAIMSPVTKRPLAILPIDPWGADDARTKSSSR
ncbi:hypothetical protein ASG87_07860 [Frateuria sp. Soil773]|uniref:TfpX/TfpZ family type IV pilin accessory protein n=1 Tax=Frateuria sp. Soil773 TaxID=1736407 RepID=UPI0006FF13F3|nr:TfpX/TfpZ family type IV pilin accessory protein [Frateuria sp. Soil773]KRE88502.1 hypothetical protein ASG87_07860 [Frateuria sp. Soil773]